MCRYTCISGDFRNIGCVDRLQNWFVFKNATSMCYLKVDRKLVLWLVTLNEIRFIARLCVQERLVI